MKCEKVLGIDPGISNCGVAVVAREGSQFQVLTSSTLRTDKQLGRGKRLFLLSGEIEVMIQDYKIELVAIEQVFFGKNVSAAMDTESVIATAELVAYREGVPSILLTPQLIKSATGLGGKASKRQVKIMMSKLTGSKFKTHHQADAVACAIAGLLRHNTPQLVR